MDGCPVRAELARLHAVTRGDPEIQVAVLDGPADLSHPCFAGADLRVLDTLVRGPAGPGPMSRHGTAVASLIFGQPGSPVEGVAPRARGLLVPVFPDDADGRVSQLDLARAIEQAVEAGAHVITISGGERAPDGQADGLLERALRRCEQSGVLVVAAVGNDGCACLQVPAAVPSVLAVGAMDATGRPLPSSNWGAAYATNGVLAPGHGVVAAVPGGGTAPMTGSSFAAPVVAGLAALLLSVQHRAGAVPDPVGVGKAILATAAPCGPPEDADRALRGAVHVAAAYASVAANPATLGDSDMDSENGPGVRPACGCEQPAAASYVYAIGTIGFDFGTEARRDAFRQQMGQVEEESGPPGARTTLIRPANPYDPNELGAYLTANPWLSDKVIWTLNLDRTPIYALESRPAAGMSAEVVTDGEGNPTVLPPVSPVHRMLRDAVVGQALPETDPDFVSRVSVPGVLTGRTVRLFSGQVVPVVLAEPWGMHTWNEEALITAVTLQVREDRERRGVGEDGDERFIRQTVRSFLDKVYHQFRNLGQTPADRALNYAATNAFVFTRDVADGLLSGQHLPRRGDGPENLYTLDTISVGKSPYERPDQDSWEVRLTFFDPENERRARVVYLFTIDVSEALPVSLAPSRQFLVGS